MLNKIERQIKFMEEKNCVFVYGGYEYLRKNRTHKAKVPRSITYNELLKNHTIFTSTVMLNLKYLKKEEIYMPNVAGEDMANWWKILKKGYTAYGITDTLAIYRVGEPSLSSNKLKAICRTWNLFKKEDIGYVKRIYCYVCYIGNAIKRRIV